MFGLTQADVWFCVRWTLGTAIALAISGSYGVYGLVVGPTLLGIAQWIALLGYWEYGVQWGISTIVGGYLALSAFVLLSLEVFDASWITVAICGVIFGTCQACVLAIANNPIWLLWPMVNSGLWVVNISGVFSFAQTYGVRAFQSPWTEIIAFSASGLVGGAMKGVLLAYAIKRIPRSE